MKRQAAKRPSPSSYHHGNLRQALVEAALEQARSAGVASITMRTVADRSGVSPAAAYHHFASKEQLLAACAERAFAGLLERMQPAYESARGSALDRLEALGRAYVEHFVAHPECFRIVFGAHVRLVSELLSPDSAGRRARALLSRAAADVALELGGDVTAEQVTQASWTTAVGAVELIVERELAAEMDEAAIAAMLDTLMAVLRGGLIALSRQSRPVS